MGLTVITSAVPGIGKAKVATLNGGGYTTAYDVLLRDRRRGDPWEELSGIGEGNWTQLLAWARSQEPDARFVGIEAAYERAVAERRSRQRQLDRQRTELLDEVEAQLVGYVHGAAKHVPEPDLLDERDPPQAWFRLTSDGDLTTWTAIILAFGAGSFAVDLAPEFDGVPPFLVNVVAGVVGWFIGYFAIFLAIDNGISTMNMRLDRRLERAQSACADENAERMSENHRRVRAYETAVEAERDVIWARDDVARSWRHFRRIRQHHEGTDHSWSQELECFRESGEHLGLAHDHVLNLMFPKMVRRLIESSTASKELSAEVHQLTSEFEQTKERLGIT